MTVRRNRWVERGDDTFTQHFLASTRRHSDRVAIAAPDGMLTYGDLENEARAIAAGLVEVIGRGTRRTEPIVMIVGARTLATTSAVFGVLLAGGTVGLVEGSTPVELRRRIALEAQPVAVVLADGSSADDWKGTASVVHLSSLRSIAAFDPVLVTPRTQALALFTSGSTGTPKCVLLEHRLSAHYRPLEQDDDWAGEGGNSFSVDDVVLVTSPVGFMMFVRDTMCGLFAGARLVYSDAAVNADVPQFLRVVERERISCLSTTPSILALLVSSPDAGKLTMLKRISTVGEALEVPLQERVLNMVPGVRLEIRYGHTEAGPSASHTCNTSDALRISGVGKPCAQSDISVMDDRGEPVRAGEIGELWVSGPGVARGYLGQPGLTAEMFVPDRWGPPGSRAYRSGDDGYELADGTIVFAGRRDQRVKVAGERLELGGIAAALTAHPHVDAAAVVTVPSHSAQPRPVACIVATEERPPERELRDYVRRTMGAAAAGFEVRFVETLPLTQSGKVDLMALKDEAAAATTPTEDDRSLRRLEAIVEWIWEETLERPVPVGAEFVADLGGRSLHAAAIVARIAEALRVEVPVEAVFEHPTVAAFAAHVAAASTKLSGSP